jgi:hypothetical protein
MARVNDKLTGLQATLAAEQAASYGYGIVGAHLTGKAFAAASADCATHEQARDNLAKLITGLGATPNPAAVAYRLPLAVLNAADAAKLAVDLEVEVLTAYVRLVGVADPALRTLAARNMQSASVRAARWGGQSQAFPGLATPSR